MADRMIELAVVGLDRPALVDDDFQHLTRYRWRLFKDGYVGRKATGRIYLHHVILPGKRYPEFVRDHINRDRLDNRLANLRWLPFAGNAQNRGAANKNALGFRGVKEMDGKYRAAVQLNGVTHRLGTFDDPIYAAAIVEDWRREHMPFTIEG